ncbi:MAG: aspartate kinase [Geminicoccaceae bacterium]
MSIVVQKFGGTSVADIDCIRHVASRVAEAVRAGHRVVVVPSAMAGTTNKLVGWTEALAGEHRLRSEYDTVVAAGEQITSGLLALALDQRGIRARSFQGWQVRIITDDAHGKARIRAIETDALRVCLEQGTVAVVAGFQGVNDQDRVTTLGRGGSDTSAVALAAALGAERCDIFTDVDGVYTSDPRIVTKARKLDLITYEEMLEMASLGAKVLQTRSVALAMAKEVRVQVLSTFDDRPGTFVVGEEDVVEQQVVSGIAYSRDEAKVTLVGVSDRPGIAATIFGALAEAGINVDMIVQSVSPDGARTDLTFTVGRTDIELAKNHLEAIAGELGCERIDADAGVVKVSVIGVGMRSHAGVAHKMFTTLADRGINIQAISTSEIKVSVLISEDYTELALRSLHTAYGLDAV